MNISKISAVSFRADNVQPEEKPKESKAKEFLHKKEAPYIIGASALAAIAIGILAVKKGKGVKNPPHNPITEHPAPHTEPPVTKPTGADGNITATPKPESPVTPPEMTVPETQESIINMGPWDDSELLEIGANVAHVDVAPGYIEPEIIKQTQNRTGLITEYLTKYMDNLEILEGVKDGTLTPLKRFKYFIKNFDERIEAFIRSINSNYVVDNINTNGLYRYKNDYMTAFNEFIKDSKSSLFKARIEENGNTILLTQKDGRKILYTFEEGEKGGLKTIKELPKGDDQTSITLHYLPDKYWDYGKIGINRIHKIEYHNTETNKLIQSITIHPDDRAAHTVILNDPNTGKPVLTMNRTAEPNQLYYDTVLYQKGKPAININTQNDTVQVIKD